MRVAGLEPARDCSREILSLLCLPIPPYPQHKKYVPTAENEGLYAQSTETLKLIAVRKVGEGGFEPPKAVPADLQSVPFGHSGIRPCLIDLEYNSMNAGKNQGFF